MIYKHIFTLGKDNVMSKQFSEENDNSKMFVITSETSYDKTKDPTKHIGLSGFKTLYFNQKIDLNLGVIDKGKFISSITVYYFDTTLKDFRYVVIHNSINLLEDLEDFIKSLEQSDKYTTVIISTNGGGIILNTNISIDTSILKRYGTTFPMPLFDRQDLFPRDSEGALLNGNFSYILGIDVKTKKLLFDSFRYYPKTVIDSTLTGKVNERKNLLNSIYFSSTDYVESEKDISNKLVDGVHMEYLNSFGLSVGKKSDDMVVSVDTNKNKIASFGKQIKYFKEHKEIDVQ